MIQGKNPPQNCIGAFSMDGDQIFTNRSYTADQTRANFLSKDVEEEIRSVGMGIFLKEVAICKCLKMIQCHAFLSDTCRGRWRTRKVRQLTFSNR